MSSITNKQITFIIQARIGSSRLPNKILLPFYEDRCILELLIEKLRQVEDTNIVVATSINPNNDVIEKCLDKYNIPVFRGSENDVLQRFIDASANVGAERIIRICSDNPFLELASIKCLVRTALSSNSDYISFNVDGTPSIKTHYGFWCEYVTRDALLRVKDKTDESLYHEHVTNYIYTHPELFDISWIEVPNQLKNYPNIRLTVDTQQDFEDAKSVYENLCATNPFPTIGEIIDYLNAHKDLFTLMQTQIISNSK